MSLLSQFLDTMENRVLHVPNTDLPMVVEAFNAESETVGGEKITGLEWRRFEHIQALYTTHRIQKQATPQNPLLAGVVTSAIGGKK